MGLFAKHDRYILLTNQKLYTLDAKHYDKGSIDKTKLIANDFDNEYLSHIIIVPTKEEFNI